MRRIVFLLVLDACTGTTRAHETAPPPDAVPASPSPDTTPDEPRGPTTTAAASPVESTPRADPPAEAHAEEAPTPAAAGDTLPDADPELAALPTDVRVESITVLQGTHRKDCTAFARGSRCELVGDLDADGRVDRVLKIRHRKTRETGIAIAWADGTVSIVGAGVRSRQLTTDVHLEGVDLAWEEGMVDFGQGGEIEWTWGLARRSGDGLQRGARAKVVHAAPGATGDGIWLDGGDAVEILYWDGARWRRLVLGF
ncbi:MAG: hypothetical protein K1X88_29705 [Nannocystaceae bacterium]|nr:hypothetical protein [Nannocystaceae bacterium]